MAAQHTAGWTRRAFLGGVTVAGVAGLLGLAPRTAAEEPPETTRLRLGRLPAICAAPYYVAAEFLPVEGSPRCTTSSSPVAHSSARPPPVRSTSASTSWGRPSPGSTPETRSCSSRGPTSAASSCSRAPVRAVRDLKGQTLAVRQLGNSEHTFISSILAYVGIDPQKEVHWVTQPFEASTQLFAAGKTAAVAAQPPQSQELRARRLGHVLVNSTVDRPWSQYYCCIVYTHQAFAR